MSPERQTKSKETRREGYEPKKSGNSVLIVVAVVGILTIIVLVGSIGAFLVYQDTRNENNREFQRLMREVDELNGILSTLHDLKWAGERMIEDGERDGRNVETMRKTLADNRRLIAEAERTRSLRLKKADSLWPR